MARDYDREYETYQGTPAQKKRRAMRNKARRLLIKNGRAKKGDGKDVHHKDHNPMNNSLSNLKIASVASNRSRKI
tara:strand:- start:93 stop:317 length:225 start_codon:yes stop_codon:yes gene_type:complete